MKNLLMTLVLVSGVLFACNDEKPKATANINHILGTWVSVDSALTKVNGEWEYTQDTLIMSKDTLNEFGKSISPYAHSFGLKGAYYELIYNDPAILQMKYAGPHWDPIWLFDTVFTHNLIFNLNKDTITIGDFRDTYPTSKFNRFFKTN